MAEKRKRETIIIINNFEIKALRKKFYLLSATFLDERGKKTRT